MRFRAGSPRPLIWRGTSKSDYMAFPATVQREMGYALFLAQAGMALRLSTLMRIQIVFENAGIGIVTSGGLKRLNCTTIA